MEKMISSNFGIVEIENLFERMTSSVRNVEVSSKMNNGKMNEMYSGKIAGMR